MQKLLQKQENWFSLWIQVANPFWQLEMLPTCSPWQRPEWPPAAIGVFGLGVFGSFSSQVLFQGNTSTLHESHPKFTEWPRNFRKKVLSGISSPQVAIFGASVFLAALVPNAVQSPHWPRKSCSKSLWHVLAWWENSIISWSTTHTPDNFLTLLFPYSYILTSEIHAPSFLVVMFGSHVPMGTEM